jgi:short-subunit dehydrogenase
MGACLALIGRDRDALERVATKAGATAPRAACYMVDLSREGEIETLTARLSSDLGPVDVLVHCAATIATGAIEQSSVEDLDSQYRTNVRAAYALTRGLLAGIRSRRGQVVFINSTAGLTARARVSQYAATKHALKALADALREEVNPDGVRVVSVFLGQTATPMQESLHEREGKPYRPERLLQPDDVAALVVALLDLPPTAEVTDIVIRPLAKPS